MCYNCYCNVQAFQLADDVLLAGVRSVTDLMVMPGLINLDFSDVQAVMADMGNAMMGKHTVYIGLPLLFSLATYARLCVEYSTYNGCAVHTEF
jgi:hypothetical protein